MTVRIITGDCRTILESLPAESVQCVVTSPPYFGLRDYGVVGQIGLEHTPAEYIAEMVEVFRHVRRVLKPDGTLWLNLGDSYAGSGRGGYPGGKSGLGNNHVDGQDNSRQARETQRRGGAPSDKSTLRGNGHIGGGPKLKSLVGVPNPNGSQKLAGLHEKARLAGTLSRAWCPAPEGLKQKDLMMMPARVALALQDDGWWLRSDIIWHKPNPMPESVTDRPTSAHEHVFLLTKGPKYYYNADAIRQPRTSDEDANTFRGGSYVGGNVDNSDGNKRKVIGNKRVSVPAGWDTGDGSHGTIHKDGRAKRGVPPRHAQYETCDQSGLSDVGRGEGCNARNVWTIASHPFSEAHFATFPPALAERCIKAGSRAGDLVLDPFGGAGTTGLVADRLQRDAVLIELNPEYAAMAGSRISSEQPLFSDVLREAAE